MGQAPSRGAKSVGAGEAGDERTHRRGSEEDTQALGAGALENLDRRRAERIIGEKPEGDGVRLKPPRLLARLMTPTGCAPVGVFYRWREAEEDHRATSSGDASEREVGVNELHVGGPDGKSPDRGNRGPPHPPGERGLGRARRLGGAERAQIGRRRRELPRT